MANPDKPRCVVCEFKLDLGRLPDSYIRNFSVEAAAGNIYLCELHLAALYQETMRPSPVGEDDAPRPLG